MPTKHGLGFGTGRPVEYDDAAVAYGTIIAALRLLERLGP